MQEPYIFSVNDKRILSMYVMSFFLWTWTRHKFWMDVRSILSLFQSFFCWCWFYQMSLLMDCLKPLIDGYHDLVIISSITAWFPMNLWSKQRLQHGVWFFLVVATIGGNFLVDILFYRIWFSLPQRVITFFVPNIYIFYSMSFFFALCSYETISSKSPAKIIHNISWAYFYVSFT